MQEQCKIEFYFRRKEVEELLAKSPDAKGIIVRQEIKPKKFATGNEIHNIMIISAFADNGGSNLKSGKTKTNAPISIFGCPSPPGCDSSI
jgi:hypothetical protein